MATRTALQLYSVREALRHDLDGTLAALADVGFRAVEVHDLTDRPRELAAALARHGLEAPSGHALLVDAPEPEVDRVLAAAQELGARIVVVPYTPPERWTSAEDIVATAQALGRVAVRAEEAGIRIGYHNHAHELAADIDGRTGLEVLVEHLDDRVVLELDLYWAARAGRDPVGLVSSLGDRVVALHVKDGTLDAAAIAHDPPLDQVPAGRGVVPIEESIAAASALELAIVEFDQIPGDALAAVAESLRVVERQVAARTAR